MEKQTAGNRTKLKGLLRLFAAAAFFVLQSLSFAQNAVRISWDYIQTLRIKPAQEYYFSASDGMFTLDIAGVKPEDIEIHVERLPDSVSFISSKKETLLAGDSVDRNGTRIILWLKFLEPGTFKIPALYVQIGHGLYTIPFEQVTVYTNPRTIQPELSVAFENPDHRLKNREFKVVAGEHIRFTVNIQYAVQMLDFKWSIPENSIFQEVERFEVADSPAIGTSFSPDIVPIVTFDWQPLLPGTYSFPKILVKATSYSGSTQELTLPSYKITVKNGTFEEDIVQLDNLEDFDYAFVEPAQESMEETVQMIEIQNLDELLALRIKERYSFPYLSKARAQRMEAEFAEGLANDKNEPSVPVFIIIVVISAIFLVGAIVHFITKRFSLGMICLSLCLLFGIVAVVDGIRVNTKYALFKGGEISPIPEEYVQSGVTVQAGSRVQVHHVVGGWAYIRFGDNYGWVPEDTVYPIR